MQIEFRDIETGEIVPDCSWVDMGDLVPIYLSNGTRVRGYTSKIKVRGNVEYVQVQQVTDDLPEIARLRETADRAAFAAHGVDITVL